jgi:hypothetical protein
LTLHGEAEANAGEEVTRRLKVTPPRNAERDIVKVSQ